MADRVLTKRHIFDFEVKYKPWLAQFDSSGINDTTVFTIDILDFIFSRDLFALSCYDDDMVFKFIDDYVDIMDWFLFLKGNNYLIRKYLDKIENKYGDYFDTRCWKFIGNLILIQESIHRNIPSMYVDYK